MKRRGAALLVATTVAFAAITPLWAQPSGDTSTTTLEAQRLQAESDRLEAIARQSELRSGPKELDFGAQLLKSFIVLAGVCLFAYLILGKVLPRLMRMSPAGRRAMFGAESRGLVEVIDRLPLEPRRIIYVLKIGDSHFLVGSAEQGLSVLARLATEDVEAARQGAERAARGGGIAGGLLGRIAKKEEQT